MIGLEGATCNTALIPEMEEIGANILLAEHIGRALVVGSEPADRLDVDVPGPLGKAGKPHVVDHTLTQRGHGRSPFGFKRQDLCPGTDQIPQHAVLNDYAFYGEAVQSNVCGLAVNFLELHLPGWCNVFRCGRQIYQRAYGNHVLRDRAV